MDIGQPVTHVSEKVCPVIHTYHVGAVDSKTKATLSPDQNTPGQSVISGENGSKISCSVKGSGGNFKFSGTLSAVTSEGDPISIQITNGVIGPDFMGTGDVSVYTPQLSAQFTSTMSCTFAVQNMQVKGGSLWAIFQCAQIETPPSGLCGILGPSSAIVFENCSGS